MRQTTTDRALSIVLFVALMIELVLDVADRHPGDGVRAVVIVLTVIAAVSWLGVALRTRVRLREPQRPGPAAQRQRSFAIAGVLLLAVMVVVLCAIAV